MNVHVALFEEVAALINNYEGIRQCHFYFVPGPDDIGIGSSLPRPPLPKLITERLRRIPRVEFVGNPFRLRFMTQEIVFFRYDLFRVMRKHCILTPRDPNGAVTPVEHMLKTICDEGHLIPLPMHVQPVYWSFDHELQLNPLPSVFVLADTLPQLQNEYAGCKVVIPGSFAADGEFLLYNLPTSGVQFSEVQ
jgi:DNA polymerase epsilon subunit 2